MTDDRLERELRSWLADEGARLRLPGSLLEDVAAIWTTSSAGPVPKRIVMRPDDTRQVRLAWPGSRSVTTTYAGKPIVAVGLIVVAILGVVMALTLNLPSPVEPAEVGASPSASPGVTPSLSPARAEAGRTTIAIDAIEFSLDMPGDWESFGSEFPNYISRSVVRGQAAEGQVSWSGYPPTGPFAMECAYLWGLMPDATVVAFADAVASVPGTDLVSRTDVTVDGRPATKIVFVVREDVGCDPGFFFTYANLNGGALWPETRPADTVRVWIVDAGPRLLVIEGKTRPEGSNLEEQIQAIVDSIRFE
jgi:hypothetical protein